MVSYAKSGYPSDGRQLWDLQRLRGLSIYFPLNDDWKRRHYAVNALPRFALTGVRRGGHGPTGVPAAKSLSHG